MVNQDITRNWAGDNMFPEVAKDIEKEKKRQEKMMQVNKKLGKIEKRLNQPLFKKGPTTKSRGKKLKVSAAKGAQGLFRLI